MFWGWGAYQDGIENLAILDAANTDTSSNGAAATTAPTSDVADSSSDAEEAQVADTVRCKPRNAKAGEACEGCAHLRIMLADERKTQ